MKPEILADEENSSSSDSANQTVPTRSVTINPGFEVGPDNQVESTTNFTLAPEIQAPPIPSRIKFRGTKSAETFKNSCPTRTASKSK